MFNPGQCGERRMVVLTAIGRGEPDLSFPAPALCTTPECAAKAMVKHGKAAVLARRRMV